MFNTQQLSIRNKTDQLLELLYNDDQKELEKIYSNPKWRDDIDFDVIHDLCLSEKNSSQSNMLGYLTKKTSYFKNAIKNNNALAYYNLYNYTIGYNTPKAYYYLYIAAKNNNIQAFKELAIMYKTVDQVKYRKYLLKAVENGYIDLYIEAANMFLKEDNFKQAFKYFKLSEENGLFIKFNNKVESKLYETWKHKNKYKTKYQDLKRSNQNYINNTMNHLINTYNYDIKEQIYIKK